MPFAYPMCETLRYGYRTSGTERPTGHDPVEAIPQAITPWFTIAAAGSGLSMDRAGPGRAVKGATESQCPYRALARRDQSWASSASPAAAADSLLSPFAGRAGRFGGVPGLGVGRDHDKCV